LTNDSQPFADAIVVAAGASSRMGGTDKLEHAVGGRPLLAYAVAAIAAAPEVRRIVIVTATDRVEPVRTADWLPASVRAVVAGGARRQESVAAGLEALEALDTTSAIAGPDAPLDDDPAADRVVLVHDGARPLVSPALVSRVVHAAAAHGAAIPVLPLAETLKRLDGDEIGETIERDGLATAQTPQGVLRSVFRRALRQVPAAGPATWTDEAALLEACRIAVHAIPGDPSNLKVTLPGDLDRVDAIITARSAAPNVRVGLGHDSHPFGPGSPLALGGLTIDGAPRLSGHSDGDVVLHAIADAILGAAGLGDLGGMFPAGPRTPRGIASSTLLGEVVWRAAVAGLVVANLDVTIVAARPRLADLLPAIGRRVAELLGIDAVSVNIKASTGNLDGREGAGRGISAHAIVSLVGTG
jgi:2-C-methyl-D-erythritol 4-phosphate cytidylyltransferase/2-C-methyl-D-erythritol 2,4-cyclodiphosphate synthase